MASKPRNNGVGIGLGAGLGAAAALLLGSSGLWLAIGMAIGIAMGFALSGKTGKTNDPASADQRLRMSNDGRRIMNLQLMNHEPSTRNHEPAIINQEPGNTNQAQPSQA
jgi:hypothetical protein